MKWDYTVTSGSTYHSIGLVITVWEVVHDVGSVTPGELQDVTVGPCLHHTSTWDTVDQVHLHPHMETYHHNA